MQLLLSDIVGVILIEIIFKGVLKALVQIRECWGMDIHLHLVFGNLSQEYVSEFSRLMGVYYYKVGTSKWMRHTQLYFWTKDFYEDLIIAGESLSGVREYIFRRAALKGIYPSWLSFLNYIWKKYMWKKEWQKERDEILPYEVLVEYKGETLFQHIVNRTIQTEIHDKNLGCCMKDIHVQLGSRVHVMKFFDGQTLFLNNYFSSNYAYMIVKRLYPDLNRMIGTRGKQILLIGYESYSEMLLVEIAEMLQNLMAGNAGFSAEIFPYIIAESGESDITFRAETGQMQEKCREILTGCDFAKLMVVLIIPISSTLTTFSQIVSGMTRLFGRNIREAGCWKNFAIIVLRDDPQKISGICQKRMKSSDVFENAVNDRKIGNNNLTENEKVFWEKIDESHKTIQVRSDNSEIQYLTMVFNEWELPLRCPKCFPEKYIYEKPLVKTNQSGLSPMIQIGIKRKGEGNLQQENIRRLNALSNVLIYKHVYRTDNHYLYYFDTNQFYSENRENIEDWLKSIREPLLLESRKYHFIVAPLHDSNAGFVEGVNRSIFGNNAHVIRLEFNKIYRSNFHMQYSYLKVLYHNLLQASNMVHDCSEINFYFVDDEIVSGKTFLRARSLLQSLLKDEHNSRVKINIFQRIYVLIDRLSDASKDNYIDDRNNFYSYVKFNISAIQNHDDFCYMCTLVKNAKQYKYMSATNKMDKVWRETESKFKLIKYNETEYGKEALKYRNRMMAAHYAEAAFQSVSSPEDVEKYCECIVRELLYKRLFKRAGVISASENNRQIFTSYIKILSRPFMVYKSEVKEASLRILLIFIEVFLGEDPEELLDEDTLNHEMSVSYRRELLSICRVLKLWQKCRDIATYELLLDFMEQLADMGSTYIIRKRNVEKIFRLFQEIYTNAEVKRRKIAREDFELQYTVFVKQLTSSGDDETKSMWVEKLFLTGNEWQCTFIDELFCKDFGVESDFGKKILIENTKVIYDTVKYLVNQLEYEMIQEYVVYLKGKNDAETVRNMIHQKFGEKIKEKLENEGELELQNFKNILELFGYNFDKAKKEVKEDEEKEQIIHIICAQCMRYILMFEEEAFNIDFDRFYKELYLLYRDSGETKEIQFLMIQDQHRGIWSNYEPYVIFDNRVESNERRQVKLLDQPLVTSEELKSCTYHMDTYHIDLNGNKVILRYDIGKSEEHIYAVLQFENMKDIKKIIFLIRLLLIYRSRTMNRMKKDFGNNLFQNLCQAKQYATFLEHFKNVTHSDPEKEQAVAVLTTILNKGTKGEKSEQEKYYIATCYKLLADINISTLYHNIITNKVMNNALDTENFRNHVIFRDTDILRRINGVIFERSRGLQVETLPEIVFDKNLNGRVYCYLGVGVHCTPLLILSILQNAYKYGDNRRPIKIWYEQTERFSHKLEYLCIANGFAGEWGNVEKIFRECILNPIGRRNHLGNSKEGITLFSANIYCRTIFKEAYSGKKEIPKQMIEVSCRDNMVIVKLPIMGGKGLCD